jgi:hypothetical protein
VADELIEPAASTRFEVEIAGKLRLAERGEQYQSGGYSSTELLEVSNPMRLEVFYSESLDVRDEDELDRLSIEIGCHHAENKETGRAFHCHQTICLPWPIARQLHAYLGFILAQMDPNND